MEKEHEERYRKLLENIEGDLVFFKDDNVGMQKLRTHCNWQEALTFTCCAHPQSYFPS